MAASSAAFSDERCIPPSNIKKEVYRGWTALCALEQFSWSLKMCKKLEEESPFSKMADAQLTYEEVEGVARLTIGKVAAGDSSPDKDDENDVQRLIKALLRRLEAAKGSDLTFTQYEEVRLVLIGRQGGGKSTFSKAAVQKARGKQGGAEADSDDELEAEAQAEADSDDELEAEAQTEAFAATAAAGGEEQPGQDWEQGANSSSEAGVTFAWRFDNGSAGGLVPVRLIDTPGVGRKEYIDQANLKTTKAHLTDLANIHGFVLVAKFKFHILDADDLKKMAQYRDMFGDAFKTRLALLYTEFPTDPNSGYVRKRNQTDVEAVMNADIVDLAKLDCIVRHTDCFFTENYPACPTEEHQLESVISGLALWGLSRAPMSTSDFNGLEDMEKRHKQLESRYFASYWHFPYRLERIFDSQDGQEYLELVNVRFPWRYQSLKKVLTFGLLGWNSVITRLRLLDVAPNAELNVKLGKIYSLKYILDSLVSQGDRLFMTSLEEPKKFEVRKDERGRSVEHIVFARCTFKKVKKFVGK